MILIKRILFIFSILICFTSYLKSNTIDSLLTAYNNEADVIERIYLLNKISKYYRTINQAKAISYGTHALELSIENKLNNQEAYSLYNIGRAYEIHDDYNNAIHFFNSANKKYKLLKNQNEIAYINYRIGTNYKKKGLYKKAMQFCIESLRIYEKSNDQEGISSVYNCMGSIYKYQKEYNQALDYYKKCIDIKKNLYDNDSTIAPYYNNLGIIYHLMGLNKLSLEYYQKSLDANLATNDEKGIAKLYTNIGNVYLSEDNFEKALKLYNESLEIRLKLGYKKGISNSYHNLGNLYYQTKDLKKAEFYLEKGLEIVENIDRLEAVKGITELLYLVNHELGMHDKAFHYLLQHKQISDSILNVEKARDIQQLEFDYVEEKQAEIEEILEQKAKIIRSLMYALLILALTIVGLLLGKQKNKIKNQKSENELIEKELKNKNKELVSNTLHLIQQNETNQLIINKLQQAKYNLKKENQPLIQEVINELKVKSDLNIWDEFEIRFLQVYETFYEKLQDNFPDLTANEKRISAFLRLDLSTKEISLITNQSPHSINMARARLRKKLNLDNTDIKLSEFLSRF